MSVFPHERVNCAGLTQDSILLLAQSLVSLVRSTAPQIWKITNLMGISFAAQQHVLCLLEWVPACFSLCPSLAALLYGSVSPAQNMFQSRFSFCAPSASARVSSTFLFSGL